MTLSNASDTLFYNTYYLLDTCLQHGKTIFDFGEAEAEQILEWMNLGYAPAFISQNIAQALSWTASNYVIEQWPSGKRGNEEAENSQYETAIAVYPVPFTDYVVIEFNDSLPDAAEFVLTDVTGRDVVSVGLPEGETRIILGTSPMPSGVYFGWARSGSQVIGSVKLIKE